MGTVASWVMNQLYIKFAVVTSFKSHEYCKVSRLWVYNLV